jgi:3-hydroxybutyrate dehydrogenase
MHQLRRGHRRDPQGAQALSSRPLLGAALVGYQGAWAHRSAASSPWSPGADGALVNNAGIAESAPLARTDDAIWDRTMALNVTAAFSLCRAVMPEMARRGPGRVVNIASNAGLRGYAYTSAYCASKHALVGLTRALAVEFARTGVTVNAVCPGFVDTAMSERAAGNIERATGRDGREALAALSPQKRMMTPEEVAHAVWSFLPYEARGITGQCIALDGGQTA